MGDVLGSTKATRHDTASTAPPCVQPYSGAGVRQREASQPHLIEVVAHIIDVVTLRKQLRKMLEVRPIAICVAIVVAVRIVGEVLGLLGPSRCLQLQRPLELAGRFIILAVRVLR